MRTSIAAPPRHLLLLTALLLPALALGACDNGTSPSTDGDSIVGTWVGSSAGLTLYFDISEDAVVTYQGDSAYCFGRFAYDIVHQNGDTYTLRSQDGTAADTFVVTLTASGDQLTIGESGSTVSLTRTDADLTQLEICPAGAGDERYTCADLPEIQVGSDVNGTLTSSDEWLGYGFFDPYHFTLTGSQAIDLTLASSQFDAYLALYDEAGNLLASNDDATTNTTDAEITATLDPGCYRVEVSSYYNFETGIYALGLH